ncbi:MAG: OmpA family protein [Bacteroidia bacterium]
MLKNTSLSVFILFVALLLCNTGNVFAQNNKAQEFFQQALQNYTKRNYPKAEALCNKAIEQSPKWVEPYLLLGDIFQTTKQPEKEIETYLRLLEEDPDQYAAYYNLANVYATTGKMKEAIANFTKLQSLDDVPAKYKELAAKRINEIAFAAKLMETPVPYDPKNLEANINSTFDDYFPTFTVDGETMYFTRRKVLDSFQIQGQSGFLHRYNEDLFISRKIGANWEKAKEIPGVINTTDNEGAMTISPDGSYMIFTGCEREDGLGSCDLYISFFIDGQWTKPANMQEPINTRNKETQPSISYDGRTIYFASNRPGTLGALDIWMSTRDDKWNFSKPVNLGPLVNTKDDDQSPFIHADNQTMYFCSRGHLGMGRNDIFVARKNSAGNWDSVQNIGYPINTVQDEPGLIVDRQGEYAYISSSNKNSIGGLDLFFFKLPKAVQPKPVTYLKGKVYDAYTKKTLVSAFELVDLENGNTTNKSGTGKDGQFLVTLPGGKNYMLNVSAKGYLFHSQNLPLKDYNKTAPYEQDIALYPIKAGENITLNNIFFPTNSFALEDKSKNELNKLVSFLKENSTVRLEISGHTDNMGKPESNKTLSQNRAKAVYDYLIKDGIAADRLVWKGYGETQPVAKNDSETGRAKNRRTEVKVIE